MGKRAFAESRVQAVSQSLHEPGHDSEQVIAHPWACFPRLTPDISMPTRVIFLYIGFNPYISYFPHLSTLKSTNDLRENSDFLRMCLLGGPTWIFHL